MSEKLGRNDPCYCGSNKKYKNCHLKPFLPNEYFECEIREFENIKFVNKIPPNAGIEVGEVKSYYSSPHVWDEDIKNLLTPLYSKNWDTKQRWENRIMKRTEKLHHKIDILKYNIELFKLLETKTENDWKQYIVANTTMNKIYEDHDLIMNVESFLFQSKSCLDVLAQIIAYNFKFEISSYHDNGNGLIKILEKNLKNDQEKKEKIIEIIKRNIPWIKELVEMRDEVTHYSDLEGLSCFLIQRSNDTDRLVKVYYPSMPNGERVLKYMYKVWNNIRKLIEECLLILVII